MPNMEVRTPASRSRRHGLALTLLGALALAPTAEGQGSSPARSTDHSGWWIGGVLVAVSLVGDAELERVALANRSPTLDALERAGDALGTGRHLIPALAASYLAGRLAGQPRLTDAVLHAAVAYVAGNVVVSVGKPLIGRHRPDTTGSPWRFEPFSTAGRFHSFPSAHTMHAFTLASAIAEEAQRRWVTATAYGLATVVGWSRIHADEHWTSDVVVSALAGAAIGRLTVRTLHARKHAPAAVVVSPGGVAVTLAW